MHKSLAAIVILALTTVNVPSHSEEVPRKRPRLEDTPHGQEMRQLLDKYVQALRTVEQWKRIEWGDRYGIALWVTETYPQSREFRACMDKFAYSWWHKDKPFKQALDECIAEAIKKDPPY